MYREERNGEREQSYQLIAHQSEGIILTLRNATNETDFLSENMSPRHSLLKERRFVYFVNAAICTSVQNISWWGTDSRELIRTASLSFRKCMSTQSRLLNVKSTKSHSLLLAVRTTLNSTSSSVSLHNNKRYLRRISEDNLGQLGMSGHRRNTTLTRPSCCTLRSN